MASKRNGALLLVGALLAGLLGAGLYQLFALRFDSGDMYPPYSSFRADPQGAKIFYQSLVALPDVEVVQQLKPMETNDVSGTTALFLGCNSQSFLDDAEEEVVPFIESGGRAVVAFRPVEPRIGKRQPASSTNECSSCATNACDEWSVELEQYTRKELKELDQGIYAFSETDGMYPIQCHSALWFGELGEEWNVLYRYLENPVVIERQWGEGTVVLLADSFIFCNEAMVTDRSTDFLVRLLGSPKRILFDEMHLGVSSQEGVMMLVNRYRMQGVLFALLLLAGLFVWQRSSSFIPRHEDDSDSGNIGTGVRSLDGFTNLLMRHIPQKKLMEAMIQEWKATFRRTPSMQGRMQRLESELKGIDKSKHPVEIHNRLTKVLNERK
ncbi:hypothetical protein PDESU_02889 [Pontiella desulfatans]|uniref:DUF4350 domain-containing protein n=1 Tax=Pontiella desulfatans TaxID=2750659 RepID=A0A6C2U2W4_PONDE|nr:DUF4350 domain-containing protein [Pontiella desulfatans]VGO14330.1 hypothetical protein PDESU_02889 [Pontiella desulfatans]